MTHITFVRGILTDSFLLYYIFYKFPNFDSCVGCGLMLFYFYVVNELHIFLNRLPRFSRLF